MTQETQAGVLGTKKKGTTSAFARVARFMGVRAITLFFTVVVGVYTTIMIANMGGYVDTIRRNDIRERVNMQVAALTYKNLTMTAEARRAMEDQMIALEENRLGLNTPFAIRSFRYLTDALQLNLGRAQQM
ncbi:ABC transporter permease, partial [bacterium]|nr:ABC transporter permease [bacterium]